VRWGHGDPVASGHLETDFLAFAATEDEAKRLVGALSLNDVKARLDALIKARHAESVQWWDAMRREGSS
jgi:hypothetical protein